MGKQILQWCKNKMCQNYDSENQYRKDKNEINKKKVGSKLPVANVMEKYRLQLCRAGNKIG